MSTNTILFKMSPQGGITLTLYSKRLLEQCWTVLHDQEVSNAKYRSLNLTEELWEQMVTALNPLQVATTALCEAEIVCVSLVYPIINSLVVST